jgi:hypothetical protein
MATEKREPRRRLEKPRRVRSRVPIARLVGAIVLLGLAFAAAAVPWWPIYASAPFIVLEAVATAVGFALAACGAIFRWRAWQLILATFGAFALIGVPLAVPGRALWGVLPTTDGLSELLAATVLGWKQLVTIVVPVGSYQSLLVPALVLVLAASSVAMTLALRIRAAEFAIIPPVIVFIAGIILGPVLTSVPIESGLAMLLAVVAWIVAVRLVRRADAHAGAASVGRAVDRGMAAGRRMLGAALLTAIALASGAAVAIAAPPEGTREVVRAYVQQPFDPRDHPSPLAGFRSYLRSPVASEPLLEVSGLDAGEGLRIATLDTYDGVLYSVGSEAVSSASGSFTRLPYRLDQSGVDGTELELTVTVAGYGGIWVPGVGQLESLDFFGPRAELLANEFVYNDTTGTAAVLGGLSEGDGYRARSVVVQPVDDLGTARPGTSVLPDAGPLPEDLDTLLDAYAPASDSPGERLTGVIEGLRRDGYVSHGISSEEPFSRSGHAADRLTELAVERPMLGDAEQYAVAAALLAREVGFPARVVMGFRVPDDASGDVVLTGRDVSAWIEVQLADGRWVGLDPNPEVREIPEKEPEEPTVVSRPQSVLPPPAENTPVDPLEQDPEQTPDDDADALPAWVQVLLAVLAIGGWILLGLAILLSPFIAVIAAKWRRRSGRRGARSAEDRVANGWREFADTATDLGYDLPATATRAEQASIVGGMHPLVLASVVDRALYGPGGPDDGDADLVWTSVDALGRRIGSTRTVRQRLGAAISLRSFGRYAVRRKGGAP